MTSRHLQHSYPDPGGAGGESAAASSYYSLHTPQGEWLEQQEQGQQHLGWELWQPPPPSLQRDRQAAVPARLDGGSSHNPFAPDRAAPPAAPTARGHPQQHQRTANADGPQVTIATTGMPPTRHPPSPSSPLLPTGANAHRPAAHRPAPLSTLSSSPSPNFITPLISTPTRSPAAPGPSTPSRPAAPLRRPAASPTHATTTATPTTPAPSSLTPAPPRQLPRIAPSPRAAASAAVLPQAPALYSLDSYGNAPHLGVGLRLSMELGEEPQPPTLAASRGRHTYAHRHQASVGTGAALDSTPGVYGGRSAREDSEAESGVDEDGVEDEEDGDYFGPLSTRSAAATASMGVAAPVASPTRAALGGRFADYFRVGAAGSSHHSSSTNQQGRGHGRGQMQAQQHQQQVHATDPGSGLGLGLGLAALEPGWGRGLRGGGGGGLGLLSAVAEVDRGRWRHADQLSRVGAYEPTSGGGGGGRASGAGGGRGGGGYYSDEDGGTVSSESSDSSDSSWGDNVGTLWPAGVQGHGASSRAAGTAAALPALRTGGDGGGRGRGGEVTAAAAGWRLPTPPSALGAGARPRQLWASLSLGHTGHGRAEGGGVYTPLPGACVGTLLDGAQPVHAWPGATCRSWGSVRPGHVRCAGLAIARAVHCWRCGLRALAVRTYAARLRCRTPLNAAADTCRCPHSSAAAGGPSPRLARLSEASALPPSASGPWRPWDAAEAAQHRDGGGGAAADPWVDRSLGATALGPSSRLHRPAQPDHPRQLLLPQSTHYGNHYDDNHSHTHQHAGGRYGAREQSRLHAQGPGPFGCVAASLDSPLLSLHAGVLERRRAGLQSATRRSLPVDPFAAVPSSSTAAQPPSAVPAAPYLYDFQGDGQSDPDDDEYEGEDGLGLETHAGVGRGRSGAERGGGGGGGVAAGPGVLTSLQLQEWMSQHASRLLLPRHLHDIADLVFRPPSAVPPADKRWGRGCAGVPENV